MVVDVPLPTTAILLAFKSYIQRHVALCMVLPVKVSKPSIFGHLG